MPPLTPLTLSSYLLT